MNRSFSWAKLSDAFRLQRYFQRAVATAGGSTTTLDPASGSITIAGSAAAIVLSLAVASGAITFSGNAPAITQVSAPTSGAVVVAGNAPSLTLAREPTSGAVLLGGNAPALDKTFAPSEGAVVIAGQVPAVGQAVFLDPTTGAVIVGGNAPALSASLAPSEGSVIVGGQTPALSFSLLPSEGGVVFGGHAPSVSQAVTLEPPSGAVIVGGETPALSFGLAPGEGSIVVEGYAPSLGTGSAGIRSLLAPWIGGAAAPSGAQTLILEPTEGAVIVGGQQANLSLGLAPSTGEIVFEGYAPSLGAATPGYRSFLAHWLGGASSTPAAPATAGYRSFLAFWAGGASDGTQIIIPPVVVVEAEQVPAGIPVRDPERRRYIMPDGRVFIATTQEVLALLQMYASPKEVARSSSAPQPTLQKRDVKFVPAKKQGAYKVVISKKFTYRAPPEAYRQAEIDANRIRDDEEAILALLLWH